MSTDRELLELAARAAGLRLNHQGHPTSGNYYDPPDCEWNPLTDDGDALRLAVKLNLWEAIRMAHRLVSDTVDIYAATRRAIVRAAAEIGRTKT
jgi:hypothetical protein